MIESPISNTSDIIKIGVLVSGTGTNLQALIDHSSDIDSHYKITCVISDKPNVYALERAKMAEIPCYVLEKKDGLKGDSLRESRSNQILKIANTLKLDALILAGFLTVLTPTVVQPYSRRIINMHPALLPKYGGKGMYGHFVHEAVLAAGEKESGCTVHLVDEGCDTGPILLQRKVPVLEKDTADSLADRIHAEEHKAIVEGVKLLSMEILKDSQDA